MIILNSLSIIYGTPFLYGLFLEIYFVSLIGSCFSVPPCAFWFFVMICATSPAFMDWLHTREDLPKFPWIELLEALKTCPGIQECVFSGFVPVFSQFCLFSFFSGACNFLLPLVSVCSTAGFLMVQKALLFFSALIHPEYAGFLFALKVQRDRNESLGSSHKSRNIGLTFHSSLSLPGEKLMVGVLFPVLLSCADLGQRLLWLLWNGFSHPFQCDCFCFWACLETATS